MVDSVATLDVTNLPATSTGKGATGIKEHTSPPNYRSQDELAQPLRLLSAAAGGAMVVYGLRDPSPVRMLLAVVGAGLVYQGISGRNVAAALTPSQLIPEPMRPAATEKYATHTEGIYVKKSVTISRPVEEVYSFWRDLRNLPLFMHYVKSVDEQSEGRSHWVVAGPKGMSLEWDAQITVDRPNEMIAWETLPGAAITNRGYVKFVEAPGQRGTEVHVALEYTPPAGAAGKFVAELFGGITEHEVSEGIRNFKQVLEAGEVPTTEGQSSGRSKDQQKTQEVNP